MALAMSMLAAIVSLILLPVMLISVLLSIMCTGLLMRYINFIVPSIFYEIDRVTASIVLAAVLAPVLGMSWRHVHVNGLINDADRCGMNDNRSCVNDFGMGKAPNVNAAIETGLGDADRDPDIGSKCC